MTEKAPTDPETCDTTADPGTVQAVFLTGEVLVSCGDGRLLVCDWAPIAGTSLSSKTFEETMAEIIENHLSRYDDQPLSHRLAQWSTTHRELSK